MPGFAFLAKMQAAALAARRMPPPTADAVLPVVLGEIVFRDPVSPAPKEAQ